MVVCALRPNVVFTRGDPLFTEILLSWPKQFKMMLMGSGTSTVISIRADNFARYILLADAVLMRNPYLCRVKNFQHWRRKGEITRADHTFA